MLLRFIFFFKQKTAYEMRISDWSSDVCSSDLEVPEQLSRLSGNQHATGMNASCAADLIRSPGPGKGTHFHPLATRVNERFDPTPPSPASDIGPLLPKVPYHPAPPETAETAGSSEERRVGTECVITFSSRWSQYHLKKLKQLHHTTKKYK